jgi:clan AA aspartic protease (TIGR02281 family)
VTGTFVFDTGASLVSMKSSFAKKASIVVSSENEIVLQTANGIANGLLATAGSVKVGNAYTTAVPVVVLNDGQLGGSDNVVGLLGMSFLSRFDATWGEKTLELRARY